MYSKSAIIEVNSDADEIEIMVHNLSTITNNISLSEKKLYYRKQRPSSGSSRNLFIVI